MSDREDERKRQASKALCSIPAATLKAILKALAPLGAGISVIAPLPERLPELIEGSLRPQSSFEYSVPGSYLFICLYLTNLYLTTHNQRIGHSNTNTVPACVVF